jgi:DNA-binding NarL/FixJ family response regulator
MRFSYEHRADFVAWLVAPPPRQGGAVGLGGAGCTPLKAARAWLFRRGRRRAAQRQASTERAERAARRRDAGDASERRRAARLLTGRELVALQLRAVGYTVREIAHLLEESPAAVIRLLTEAAHRLGVADGNVAQAVTAARQRGLIV